MNNGEYTSFRREIMKYKNLVNQGRINRISKQVKEGNKTRNQGLVEAYNEANIEYRAQMTGYYPTMLTKVLKMLVKQKIITGGQMAALVKDRAMRTLVRDVSGKGPSRPPCVKIQNARGCSNARKAVQGFGRSTRRAVGSAVSTPFRAAGSAVSKSLRRGT
tara:strand:- start:65 stop:547 length:483 start_codon:yes stop_codon:yes gene_type:complete